MGSDATDNRIRMMIARGTVAGVDDDAQAQSVQIDLLADETHEGVERFQEYGFTSVPHAGAEVIMVAVGGLRSHGIVIAVEDRRYRMKSLKPGEVALYDDLGQSVVLTRDGITVDSPIGVTVTTPLAKVIADHVDLGGEGGRGVARIGDAVANGVITAGSAKVFAA